jgi:hypothetical protein
MLQIVKVRRQNSSTIPASQALCNLLLSEARLLARLGYHLTERFHSPDYPRR